VGDMLGGGLGGLPNGRYCWVEDLYLAGHQRHGRVSFDTGAGFSMAGFV
jgi:hypothetical protein